MTTVVRTIHFAVKARRKRLVVGPEAPSESLPDRLPLRPLDELVAGVNAFCSTIASHGASRPHMLAPSVLGATRNHPMLWHAIRDLPHSVLVYRVCGTRAGRGS